MNPNYVQHVEQLGLAPSFFDFLSLEHPNNNVHNIRLCRQLVSAGSMSGKDLHRRAVADKVGTPRSQILMLYMTLTKWPVTFTWMVKEPQCRSQKVAFM